MRYAARALRHIAVLAATLIAPLTAHAAGDVVRTENVAARLVSDVRTVAPGETFQVALHKEIRDRWHTYWRNPGDAGEPTRIEWELPEGFSAGDITWPTPKAITLGGVITNYGYEGELILSSPITAPADLEPGAPITIRAGASWLVCEEICIPESADLEITLQTAAAPAAHTTWGPRIARTLDEAPKPSGFQAGLARTAAGVRLSVADAAFRAAIADETVREVAFFPFSGAAIDHNAAQPVTLAARGLAIDLKPAQGLRTELVPTPGVLVFEERRDGRWRKAGVEIDAVPGGVDIGASDDAAAGGGASGAGGLGAGGGASQAPGGGGAGPAGLFSIIAALAAAFVGGLILNLMPCVFPVLSIKALSFVNKAHDHPADVRRHGLIFLAGVMVTFLGLAGALIGLQAAGAAVGWGFQLQSPLFVAALALLMFAIGLNLLGTFEIGTSLQGMGSGLAAKQGDQGAFFTGVLAVVVATPCTAPFMAGALGFALAQPAYVSLLVFAFLGLGLAAPFVALSFAPGALKALPKPGPWMETLKQFFAFPMFLTAVWLVWVLGVQAGPGAVLAVLAAMTAAAFFVWVLQASRGAQGLLANGGRIAAAGLVALALAGVAVGSRTEAVEEAGGTVGTAASLAEAGVDEGAWSLQRVAELRAAGRPVFVDFTAAWCITCQFNKRAALTTPGTIDAFADHDVAFLTADWTARDSVIAEELAAHGRSGVPLYLMYATEGEPVILPQLLTERIVVDAVRKAAGGDQLADRS